MVFDAVLFDLDGTITDPAEGIVASFRHALETVGYPADPGVDLTWAIGPPIRESFGLCGLPDALHTDAIAAFRERHLAVGLFEATLVPGMVEVLDALVTEGTVLGLATAKPHAQALTTLEHFSLRDRFKVVGAAYSEGVANPKELIVADALDQLGLGPAAAVAMVGDRVHDVVGGRSNGCRTVSVTWGYAQPGELERAAPDHVVADAAELLAVLTGPVT